MKREEWYSSVEFKKLRLFGNVASEIRHKCQYLYDILEIIVADKPELLSLDRFTLMERQLRILQLEAGKLVDLSSCLTLKAQPKFDDWDENGPIQQEGK